MRCRMHDFGRDRSRHLDGLPSMFQRSAIRPKRAVDRTPGRGLRKPPGGARDRRPADLSTERKYMATIIQSSFRPPIVFSVAGAPEIVRARCAPDGKDEQVAEQLLVSAQGGRCVAGRGYAETAARGSIKSAGCSPRRSLHFSAASQRFRDSRARVRRLPGVAWKASTSRSSRATPPGYGSVCDRPARSACGTMPAIPTACAMVRNSLR